MPETMEDYKQRILSYQAGQDPLKLLDSAPRRLQKLLAGVPRRTLSRRPAPGKWSIIEIVAHLAEDELVGAYRLRRILAEPGSAIQAFDQDKWAKAGQYAKHDIQKSFEMYRALREANLRLLTSLDRAQWRHHGVHEERGVETIRDIAKYYAGHDINHFLQIEAALGRKPKK